MSVLPRDSQRQRVYNAEVHIPDLTGESAAAKRILQGSVRVRSTGNVPIAAVQEYVDHLTGSAWFRRQWGYRKIRVMHKVWGNATASLTRDEIAIPPWARIEKVILHEVAHCLINGGGYAPHGPEFVGVLMTLIRHRQGAHGAERFREGIARYRVKMSMAAVPRPSEARRKRADHRAASAADFTLRKDRAAAAKADPSTSAVSSLLW